MTFFHLIRPFLHLLPAEFAHRLGLLGLRLPWLFARTPPSDPFAWNGLTFRNRVGIAAGFDKDAEAVPGIARLGVGFVEVGTILVAPWPGNDRPRLERLPKHAAVWNRLGFPSQGLDRVKARLSAFPRERRRGMLVACNIGPHPGHLKAATDNHLSLVGDELRQLAAALRDDADFFVVNLSSPNTQGLRQILLAQGLAKQLATLRNFGRPVLVKLPPEDADRNPWTRESLSGVVEPMLSEGACDGFVAVNTSTRLTASLLSRDLGGVSGRPLHSVAVEVVRLLREIIGPKVLLIGCGGVSAPADAVSLVEAGADLVELYTGLIYEGPGLPARCATALRSDPI